MIRIVAAGRLRPARRGVRDVDAFDWIVFTSANAVDAFMDAPAGDAARRARA